MSRTAPRDRAKGGANLVFMINGKFEQIPIALTQMRFGSGNGVQVRGPQSRLIAIDANGSIDCSTVTR